MHAAGLDTIEVEPPPPDSALLAHPRVVLTPHDAGASDAVFGGLTGIIAENLRRLEAAEPLRFRVPDAAGRRGHPASAALRGHVPERAL
jgi:phosphoglycerate dehydrogenase-like enzyme